MAAHLFSDLDEFRYKRMILRGYEHEEAMEYVEIMRDLDVDEYPEQEIQQYNLGE